jgi:hypothetical protein
MTTHVRPRASHRGGGRQQVNGESIAEVLSQTRGQSIVIVSIPTGDVQRHVRELMRQRKSHSLAIVGSVQHDEPTASLAHDAAAHPGMHRLFDDDDIAMVDPGETIDDGNRRDRTGGRELGGQSTQ